MKLIRYKQPTLDAWTGLNRLTSFRDEMNRLFETMFQGSPQEEGLFSGWAPAIDVYQDKDNVSVVAELPGMKKEEVEISFQDGLLSISGERKYEKEHKEGETFRSERAFGKFYRAIALPAGVDADKAKATYKDGVLTIRLPKTEEAKPRQISVNVD